jgi:hypothetical protein
MLRYSLLFAVIILTGLVFISTANAQYWFQSGARGSNNAAFNNGGSITIQTIYQNATDGSLGFWLGESLSNGAFIQVGYEIPNATGYYSTSCTNSSLDVYLKAGSPAWFWEYFPADSNENAFCGGIGQSGSAGANKSFNTYSLSAAQGKNIWSAYFNNQLLGSINLGTDSSGANPVSAFTEYADADSNIWPISTVQFKDLAYLVGNSSRLVPEGYSVVSYGKGSSTALSNPYGVEEFGNFTDYFEVGSKIPVRLASSEIWQIGYSLAVYSAYGNVSSNQNYTPYSNIPLSVPRTVNVSNGTRELFTGWVGKGPASYTGNQTTAYITVSGNITETATWKRQYYLNTTSEFGSINGGGWYDANSTVTVSLTSNVISVSTGEREEFSKWSNGDTGDRVTLMMNGPKTLKPLWETQYYLDATSPHGNVTGSGWYDANSTAEISLSGLAIPINQTTRYEFYNWSNGNTSSKAAVFVDAPITINANFRNAYLVEFDPENSNGDDISPVAYYNVSSMIVNGSEFYAFANKSYSIEYIYYKGVPITTNYHFDVDAPSTVSFKTPVYNVAIQTQSVFGTPVNASVSVTFKNNTKANFYTNSTGSDSFVNVPYGYVSGYAEYFGIQESISLSNGSGAYLTFLTESIIIYIIGGIVLVVIISVVVILYERRHNRRT